MSLKHATWITLLLLSNLASLQMLAMCMLDGASIQGQGSKQSLTKEVDWTTSKIFQGQLLHVSDLLGYAQSRTESS